MAPRQALCPSRPCLLPSSHPIRNAHVKLPSAKLIGDHPSSYQRCQLPSLPFAGHDRITSIFPLRKPSEPELQSLEKSDTNLKSIPRCSPSQAAQKESIKKEKSSTFKFSDYVMTTSSRSYIALKDELVQPLDTKDAAIKDSYDATTIARDVLIAANQHPTENGLNRHLMVLRKNIAVVNFSSDLETFRWDVIDPVPAKSPKRSTSNMTTSTFPHGSETSVERRSSLRQQHSSESRSLESTSHKSSSPSTPCPVEKPVPRTTNRPNRVVKPSSGPTTLKTQKIIAPPQRSPYFNITPQPQVVISVSPDHKAPPIEKPAARTPTHTNRVTKPSRGQPARKTPKPSSSSKSSPDPKSLKRSPRRSAIAETTREIKKPVADFHHPFQCRWANCQRVLPDRQSLRAHIMKEHIVSSLTCGWDTCDCKLPLAAVPLWHHVLDVHISHIKLGAEKGLESVA